MTPKSVSVESNEKIIMSSPDKKIPDVNSPVSSDDGFNEFMKVLASANSVKSTVSSRMYSCHFICVGEFYRSQKNSYVCAL